MDEQKNTSILHRSGIRFISFIHSVSLILSFFLSFFSFLVSLVLFLYLPFKICLSLSLYLCLSLSLSISLSVSVFLSLPVSLSLSLSVSLSLSLSLSLSVSLSPQCPLHQDRQQLIKHSYGEDNHREEIPTFAIGDFLRFARRIMILDLSSGNGMYIN